MKIARIFTVLLAVAATSGAKAQLFSDNFARGADPVGLAAPWQTNSGLPGAWTVTGGVLRGGPNAGVNYGFAYIATNWGDYSLSAKLQFSSSGGYGGGLGGRLNAATGAHYAAWVFPEQSPAGLSNVVRLIKFSAWNSFTFLTADLPVASVGTAQHTLRLDFKTNQVAVYYDSNLLTNYTDLSSPYLTGGITSDMWSDPATYTFSLDDLLVSAITSVPSANNDNYNSVIGTTLTIVAPGVLANDTGGVSALSAVLATSPTHGNFSFSTNGGFSYTATNGYTGLDNFTYRASDGVTNSGIATVTITVTTNTPPVANADNYTFPAGLTSTITAPGVLANDTDVNGNTLSAVLVTGPTNGTLSLNASGAFTYTPTGNYTGPDAFTYRANDGLANSSVSLVSISVLTPGALFSDSFTRGTDPFALASPWQTNTGVWSVTGGILRGGTNAPFNYGFAFVPNTWTDYSVQARVQFSNTNGWGGGIGGRLIDSAAGAHYAAWVYPDGSAGGSNILKLIKFTTYTSFVTLAQAQLGPVGNSFHTIKLAFAGNQIGVFIDGIPQLAVTDSSSPYLSGGITTDMWTDGVTPYTIAYDDIAVKLLAVDDYYNVDEDTLLTIPVAGVLTNDSGISGGPLAASLVSGTSHGTLNLDANGSFTYLPDTNYTGPDSFTYLATDGAANLGEATVNITVATSGPRAIFTESFDGVTAPALPLNWTTAATGAQSPWITTNGTPDTAPNAAFSRAPATPGSNNLTSPNIALPDGLSRLAFRHSYVLETASSAFAYDGAALEIKIGAGAFTDILAAGGSFVSGGYNYTMTNGIFNNALSNRLVWSGNSGGYISTLVNLPPAAAGQSIQLRWVCATDDTTSTAGWRVDTVSITNCPTSDCWNVPAVFATQSNRTVVELTTLTVTNTATDSNVPADALTYSLLTSPSGAAINPTTGVITWTPTEAQGPSTNTFRTRVVDSGSPNLSATNTFVVTVTETNNNAPVFATQTNRIVFEGILLTITNSATDADVPANTLTYSLLVAPAGATINGASGVISWTPSEAQGGTTNTITTRVTDNGSPALLATNSFTVAVLKTNSAPNFLAQTNRTIAELTLLTVTNTATDNDLPADTLTYTLLAAPAGAQISTNGVITWTPTEAQGPSTNIFTTRVVDNGTPVLGSTNSFTVIVTEVNTAPTLPAQTNLTIAELTSLVITNTASDSDLPANNLTYVLTGPATATISTNGVINWTPSEAEGPSTNAFTTVVSDGALSATNTFTVVVLEVNSAPTLAEQPNVTISELTFFSVTNAATDADLPANVLAYSLVNPPSGAVIDTNGVITWTPSEAQGPSTNTIVTVVSDGTASVTNSFVVAVTEVNVTPVFVATPSDATIAELTTLIVTNAATDADLPANVLTYSLVNAPSGAVIDTNGVITWTPSEAQGPSTNTIATVVSDGTASVTNSFVVTVTEVNVAPVFVATPSDATIAELTTLIVTNAATDMDLPANVLTYSLVNPPSGAVIDTNGVITWTPSEAQGPSTNTIVTVVSDGTVSVTNSFVVIVTEVNVAPVFVATPSDATIAELTTLIVTNAATDADLPANVLTYSLVNPPSGAVIDTNGVITWTPSEAQGPSTNTIVTVVSDGTVSVTNSFVVIVTEVNVAPVFVATPSDATIAELTTLIVTNAATDADLPANVLTYSLLVAPTNAAINPSGSIAWTPTAGQGGTTNTFTTVVTDNGFPALSATNSFVVVVTQPAAPPVIQSIVVTNDIVTVTWSATVGRNYYLQGVADLGATNWVDIGAQVSAVATSAAQTNGVAANSQRFYRVRMTP